MWEQCYLNNIPQNVFFKEKFHCSTKTPLTKLSYANIMVSAQMLRVKEYEYLTLVSVLVLVNP